MMCLNPLTAWRDNGTMLASGKHPIIFKLPHDFALIDSFLGHSRYSEISIPCGKCFNCLKSKSHGLLVRAVKEASCYDFNSFITLTVSDENLEKVFPNGSLIHRPWQLFLKRLGKRLGKCPRFLMCAEYGSKSLRPHYHAVLFGVRFTDICVYPDGSFTSSKLIQECWPFGQIQCADVNQERIAYVSGYTLKDYQLGRDHDFYDSLGLAYPYFKWSRNPGLGAVWFDKFFRDSYKLRDNWSDGVHSVDVVPHVVLGNKSSSFHIRYFDERLALRDPDRHAKLLLTRERSVSSVPDIMHIMRHEDSKRKASFHQYLLSQKERDTNE